MRQLKPMIYWNWQNFFDVVAGTPIAHTVVNVSDLDIDVLKFFKEINLPYEVDRYGDIRFDLDFANDYGNPMYMLIWQLAVNVADNRDGNFDIDYSTQKFIHGLDMQMTWDEVIEQLIKSWDLDYQEEQKSDTSGDITYDHKVVMEELN